MTRRTLLAALCLLGICRYLPAQQVPERFAVDGGPFGNPLFQLPSVTLENQDRFSFATAFNWHTPVSYLPPFSPSAPKHPGPVKDDSGYALESVPEIRTASPIYVGGEIGFLYGKSSGKYGVEYQQGYIMGEIGNEWFHLTVGTSYESSSGRVPRWRP